jgi:uncharacterized protein (TIGR00725 family)
MTNKLLLKSPVIAVIGGGTCTPEIADIACDVGREIARRKGVLICGGLTGVMHAACQGAAGQGGLTIGVLPGKSAGDANPYVQIPIVTGMSDARNIIIIRSAHAAIAVDGGFGTLSEIAFALKFKTPVVGIGTWNVDPAVQVVESAELAVQKAFALAELKRP